MPNTEPGELPTEKDTQVRLTMTFWAGEESGNDESLLLYRTRMSLATARLLAKMASLLEGR